MCLGSIMSTTDIIRKRNLCRSEQNEARKQALKGINHSLNKPFASVAYYVDRKQ